MNPIGLCATDAKSLVAVIKAAQKAGIKRIIVADGTFYAWWRPFYKSKKDNKIKNWMNTEGHCEWVGNDRGDIWFDIWPADMNPKGF